MGALENKLDKENYQKLVRIKNPSLHKFIVNCIELCNPEKIFVSTDSPIDIDYIRRTAISSGEEKELAIKGHTVHFDGYFDQARDRDETKILVKNEASIDPSI